MTRQRSRLGVIFVFVGCLFPPIVFGQTFEAFRLKSGMTPEQARLAVPGYELRWTDVVDGGAFLVRNSNEADPDIYASLSFCRNRLVAVVRQIDPDIDLVRYLSDRLRDFGQPRVSVTTQPWTGAGGGDISRIDFTWVTNGVRYMLSISPEERTGKGELRHTRNASVSFVLDQPCKK